MPRKFSEAELRELADFWDTPRPAGPLNDSIAAILDSNRGRNLIMIIVESWNSAIFSMPGADAVCPCTDSLRNDPATLFFGDITAMTGHGRSSDGQFIINTGLLPLRDEALVTRYADADYPSLAKRLGHHAVEVISENRSLWNHFATTRSYGYSGLYDDKVPKGTPIAIQDSTMFAAAMDVASTLPTPFMLEITTIGMHQPYTRPTGVSISPDNVYDSRDRHYLEAVHAFDRSLRDFIGSLHASGLYDNSVIVIVADHEEGPPMLSEHFDGLSTPMMILNSSLNRDALPSDITSRPAYQMDIFPTVLDIMGHTDTTAYRGMGNSLIRPLPADTVPVLKLREISEKTIRTHCTQI